MLLTGLPDGAFDTESSRVAGTSPISAAGREGPEDRTGAHFHGFIAIPQDGSPVLLLPLHYRSGRVCLDNGIVELTACFWINRKVWRNVRDSDP